MVLRKFVMKMKKSVAFGVWYVDGERGGININAVYHRAKGIIKIEVPVDGELLYILGLVEISIKACSFECTFRVF